MEIIYILHVKKGAPADYKNQSVMSLIVTHLIPEDFPDRPEGVILEIKKDEKMPILMTEVINVLREQGNWPKWADNFDVLALVKRYVGTSQVV